MASKPTKVKVDGITVVIEWGKKNLGRLTQGYPVSAKWIRPGLIRMGASVRRNAERENLMHELLHELWYRAGLQDVYSEKIEEYILSSLDGRLVDLLRDNPKLVAYLLEEDG